MILDSRVLRRLPVGFGLLVAAACGSEPPPALTVGAVSYSESELLGLSESRRNTLADLAAFGQAIAEFQNTQFMLADMATDVEAARALLYVAALKVTEDAADKTRFAAMAKLKATDAGFKVRRNAIIGDALLGTTVVFGGLLGIIIWQERQQAKTFIKEQKELKAIGDLQIAPVVSRETVGITGGFRF